MMGLSDAHCGAICDGGMPTFMLTHWTRDCTRGEKLSLPYIIHRQTQQTAEFYGLHDRGILEDGYRADINTDYEALSWASPRWCSIYPQRTSVAQRASGIAPPSVLASDLLGRKANRCDARSPDSRCSTEPDEFEISISIQIHREDVEPAGVPPLS